jgi:plasmid stabilization system protein ParE
VRGVRFHPEAEAEFIAAGEFYEAQAAGLGFDFVAEVRHAARTIAAHPEVGHRFSKRLRRTLVRRFPYGLLYRVDADTIFVVAVMHLRRRPGYWKGRV